MPDFISVKQLNAYVRTLLDGDSRLNYITVNGEISNFKNHYSSGHLYFSLKDPDASIRCVMFRSSAASLQFSPKDSDSVLCTGKISVYEKDGQYQMYVEKIVPVGMGELAEKFRIVKEKLEKEGLFALDTKRKLPAYPSSIAVITSSTGAALQDIINIISRRYPICKLILIPALVQGENAPKSLISSLEKAYETTADLIIIGRGGGSTEDLSAFNDEALARKIYESPIPVISAVGHETDFTICDFVADMRAPTPSAAAEIAVPDIEELKSQIESCERRLKSLTENRLHFAQYELDKITGSAVFSNPLSIIKCKSEITDKLFNRLTDVYKNRLIAADKTVSNLSAKLDALSPLKVLARGYAVIESGDKTVKSCKELNSGDKISITFTDGAVNAQVE